MRFEVNWRQLLDQTKGLMPSLFGLRIWLLFTTLFTVSCDYGTLTEEERDERIAEGIFALSIFDFNNAYNSLLDIQASLSKEHEDWVMVSYALATAAWQSTPPQAKNVELAKQLLEQIAHLEGDSAIGIQARMDLARISEIIDYPGDSKDIVTARGIYRSIKTQYPGTALGTQATLRLAETYAEDLTTEGSLNAIDIIKSYLHSNPNAEWGSVAWQYLGDLHWQRFGNSESALKAYQAADTLGFANIAKTDTYLWRMAMWASQSGNMLEAVEIWTRIVTNYPRSIFGTVARDKIISFAEANPTLEISVPSRPTLKNASSS